LPSVIKYNHEVLRAFWIGFDEVAENFERTHILQTHLTNLIDFCRFMLGLPLLLCILAMLHRLVRNRRLRIPLMLMLFFYLGLALEVALLAHYWAPATVLVFLIATAAVREVACLFSPGKMRIAAICALFCAVVIFDVSRIGGVVFRLGRARVAGATSRRPHFVDQARMNRQDDVPEFIAERNRWLTFLRAQPGEQLVLVRYGPSHDTHREWVFNEADIDHSRIVWARSMPNGKDDELLRYYPHRQVWVLDATE